MAVDGISNKVEKRQGKSRQLYSWPILFKRSLIYVLYIVIFAVVAFVVFPAIVRRQQWARLLAEERAFMTGVEQNRALPNIETNVILKSGESAFYSAPSTLETRAVRHYQAGHAGFRVAKGVYIGDTSGRSTSTQEWSKIDTGYLTVTNNRLIFDGGEENRSV